MSDHMLILTPQAIVDGWQALCPCGWKRVETFYSFGTKDELIGALMSKYADHIQRAEVVENEP